MVAISQGVRHFLLAIQFFTRIPVTGRVAAWVGFQPAMQQACVRHLPGVGWIIGSITAVALILFYQLLPKLSGAPWVAVWLSMGVGVWCTGAFHEDGLADLTDGLGGSAHRDRALEIMKDSRVGSFGVLALVFALLLKAALLVTLTQSSLSVAVQALLAGHVTSRWQVLLLMRALPYVSPAGKSKSLPLTEPLTSRSLLVATLWCLPAWCLLGVLMPSWQWVSGMSMAILAWLWMRRLLERRLQGYTGDALGAVQQVCELAFYLGLVLFLGVTKA